MRSRAIDRCRAALALTLAVGVLAPGLARADYYYAVAVGEKRFHSREDRAYRATRAAMTRCTSEFDPLLCTEVRLERVDGRWESLVVGRKGFYAADRDHPSRAERQALAMCQAASELGACRLEPRDSPTQTPPEREAPGLTLEDLLGR